MKDLLRYIALTFDDGTIKQYHTIKALSKFDVKCTMFCTTHLRKQPDTNVQLLALEPEKIEELHNLGHEIGSHTCTHPHLTEIHPEKLVYEMKESKRMLEDVTGSAVLGFAYPYSVHNPQVVEEARRYYGYARTGPYNSHLWDRDTDLFRIPSIGVKKLLTIPYRKTYERDATVGVVMLHDILVATLLPIIYYLKVTLRADLITMKEAVSHLQV